MKRHFLPILLFFLSFGLAAQINETGFSFQGYARDFDGNAVGNATIKVTFTIYPVGGSSSPGSFSESHDVETDAFGLFSATVGTVSPNTFKVLNWSLLKYMLKVVVTVNGSDEVTIHDGEMLSVPYAQAANKAANGVPVGTILPFGGDESNLPDGFLLCNGTSYSQSLYPDLYAAIGTAWGGTTSNFRVPDLRGYFLRGVAGSATVDPDASARSNKYSGGNTGNDVGTYQEQATLSHTHSAGTFNVNGDTESSGNHQHDLEKNIYVWYRSFVGDGDSDDHQTLVNKDKNSATDDSELWVDETKSAGAHTHAVDINVTGTSGASIGTETRPKNAYVNYIIKY